MASGFPIQCVHCGAVNTLPLAPGPGQVFSCHACYQALAPIPEAPAGNYAPYMVQGFPPAALQQADGTYGGANFMPPVREKSPAWLLPTMILAGVGVVLVAVSIVASKVIDNVRHRATQQVADQGTTLPAIHPPINPETSPPAATLASNKTNVADASPGQSLPDPAQIPATPIAPSVEPSEPSTVPATPTESAHQPVEAEVPSPTGSTGKRSDSISRQDRDQQAVVDNPQLAELDKIITEYEVAISTVQTALSQLSEFERRGTAASQIQQIPDKLGNLAVRSGRLDSFNDDELRRTASRRTKLGTLTGDVLKQLAKSRETGELTKPQRLIAARASVISSYLLSGVRALDEPTREHELIQYDRVMLQREILRQACQINSALTNELAAQNVKQAILDVRLLGVRKRAMEPVMFSKIRAAKDSYKPLVMAVQSHQAVVDDYLGLIPKTPVNVNPGIQGIPGMQENKESYPNVRADLAHALDLFDAAKPLGAPPPGVAERKKSRSWSDSAKGIADRRTRKSSRLRPVSPSDTINAFIDLHGKKNVVCFILGELNDGQTRKVSRQLQLITESKAKVQVTKGETTTIAIKFAGDLEELSQRIDFAEVLDVDEAERTIQLDLAEAESTTTDGDKE